MYRIVLGPFRGIAPNGIEDQWAIAHPGLARRRFGPLWQTLKALDEWVEDLPVPAKGWKTLKDIGGHFNYIIEFPPVEWGGPDESQTHELARQAEEVARQEGVEARVEVSFSLPPIPCEAVRTLASWANSPYQAYGEFVQKIANWLASDEKLASRFRSALLKAALAFVSSWQVLYNYNSCHDKKLKCPWE